MLECRDAIYPAFATHNAHNGVCSGMRRRTVTEMQRLHGMGEALYHGVGDISCVKAYARAGT